MAALLLRRPGPFGGPVHRIRFYSGLATERPLFDKILIANRGEIACRVIRTARKLGVKTVAVYSEADRNAMHVAMADEAHLLGPAPSAQSYLRGDKIIEIAHKTGAQAIHPGYGFLSENAAFARLCAQRNVVFIGPPEQAILDMGSKSASKNIMNGAGVRCVPGYHGTNQEDAFLMEQADKIGYPVLIKAVSGGGGKGMRIVHQRSEFISALESSRRESLKSFADDRVLVEKYLTTPRHVEVQVFADTFGDAVYLFERDCSVQRRHQKIIEEAPAPGLPQEVREQLGQQAVMAAKAVNYVGAGTVEFIMDNTDNSFYFMEMNTRLQVEHPVTEMITDVDLVEWQLRVAAGNRLPMRQEDLKPKGHAFEARIYAEKPENDFLPDTGRLQHLSAPAENADLRVETGVRPGDEVSIHYDPMIAKLVVRGADRTEALRRLRVALDEYRVVGPSTNVEFLKVLASHPSFVNAEVETGFIAKHKQSLFPKRDVSAKSVAAAALYSFLKERSAEVQANKTSEDPHNPWFTLGPQRINHLHERSYDFEADGVSRRCVVTVRRDGLFDVSVKISKDGNTESIQGIRASLERPDGENGWKLRAEIDGRTGTSTLVEDAKGSIIHLFGEDGRVSLKKPVPAYNAKASSATAGAVVSPMPCKISNLMVKPGQRVEKDTPLLILEAMKMEHVIRSPKAGTVARFNYQVGDLVPENKVLVVFEEDSKA